MIVYLSSRIEQGFRMLGKAAIASQEPVSSTRDRILGAAQRLFAERGYANVSMPTIARASGITAGAIYRHFEGKEDLFFRAVAQRAVEAAAIIGQGSSDPALDLPQVVAAYTTERLKLLRQLAVEVHAASVHNTKVRRLLKNALNSNFEQIRGGIVFGQRSGALDQTLDPDLAARAVLVFVMGLMHMETLLPDLIGDRKWHGFVAGRAAALMGAR
jgi:AcrR family transcriptional regulator